MGGLNHVEAGLETSFGMIELVLNRKGRSRFGMTLTVPEGTTAVVKDFRSRVHRLGPGVHVMML